MVGMSAGTPKMVKEREVTATLQVPEGVIEAAKLIANRNEWTVERAIAFLLKRGVEAQAESDRLLAEAYNSFITSAPEGRSSAGDELIRSIFGPSSVA